MIPLTPKFLTGAAQSMASQTPDDIAEQARGDGAAVWDATVSWAFVQRAGFWSHYRQAARWSAWPLTTEPTLERAWRRCRRAGLLREELVPGAIALVAARASVPNAERFVQCGIVTNVLWAAKLPDVRQVEAEVTWAVLDPTEVAWAIDVTHTFDLDQGDRFMHWWHLPMAYPGQQAA